MKISTITSPKVSLQNLVLTKFGRLAARAPAFKQYFYNPFCFNCGSVFVERHLFCEYCFENDIESRIELKRRKVESGQGSYDHYYLFDWIPGESDLLSKMVYQLKSNRCLLALEYYSGVIAEQMKNIEDLNTEFDAIVPIPGSTRASTHSDHLAEYIARRFKRTTLRLLKKSKTDESQKKLSLSDRQNTKVETKMGLDEHITKLRTKNRRVLYVDDILTSGSTFKASHKALAIQGPACIVTLFYRPVSTATFT